MLFRALEEPEQAANLGLDEDPTLVEMTALVVAGHREAELGSRYDSLLMGSATIRPRLLASLLHLADELDLDYRRVDLQRLRLLQVAPEQALDWWLHYYVSGVQVAKEFIKVGYRVPKRRPDHGSLLPDLIAGEMKQALGALKDPLRLYDVRVDVETWPQICAWRSVQPMPDEIWAAAQRRLAELLGEESHGRDPLHPLVERAQGLLETMGYSCQLSGTSGSQMVILRCQPEGGGLRSQLVVGCRDGPLEVSDVQAVTDQLTDKDEQCYLISETSVLQSEV